MASKPDSDDDFAPEKEPSAWTRPRFVLSAVFVLLVVIAAVVIAVSPPGRGGAQSGTGPTDGYAPGTDATAPTDATPLTAAPEAVEWDLFDGQAVPTSATYGPARDDGTTATGYTRAPEGALIAAAQISSRSGINVPQAVWEATIGGQFVAGPDRDALLKAMRAAPASDYASSEIAAISGFIYRSFTADSAVIELVLDAGGGGHIGLLTTLVWIDGDWRMTPPPAGDWAALMRQVTDLAGVTEWSAS